MPFCRLDLCMSEAARRHRERMKRHQHTKGFKLLSAGRLSFAECLLQLLQLGASLLSTLPFPLGPLLNRSDGLGLHRGPPT